MAPSRTSPLPAHFTRSRIQKHHIFKNAPAGPALLPDPSAATPFSLALKWQFAIVRYLEEHDSVFRGLVAEPSYYRPLLPASEERILNGLPSWNDVSESASGSDDDESASSSNDDSTSGSDNEDVGPSTGISRLGNFVRTYAGHRSIAAATDNTVSADSIPTVVPRRLQPAAVETSIPTASASAAASSVSAVVALRRRPTPAGNARVQAPANSSSARRPRPLRLASNPFRDLISRLERMHDVKLATWDRTRPAPMTDSGGFLTLVLSAYPSDRRPEWVMSSFKLALAMEILHEKRAWKKGPILRWGIGPPQAAAKRPHTLTPSDKIAGDIAEVGDLTTSAGLRLASAYQNRELSFALQETQAYWFVDLVRQFFPELFATLQNAVGDLFSRGLKDLEMPFENSAFPTCELRLLNADRARSDQDAKQWVVEPGHVFVGTVYGEWNPACGGYLILHDDKKMVALANGTTFIIAGGTKRFGFAPVGVHEQQVLFGQYFHGSVFRWLEKGGRTEWDWDTIVEEGRDGKDRRALRAWREKRKLRALQRMKLFPKLEAIAGSTW
uniref:Uncharacterized protein n=1 Tax=Mycena chlorophos TaxID=658473 RepID=A0ABQ0L3Q3_MYCCL|nr:predicted protein [Mycena chlorophos]